jgi:hypothetical protein|tara:strand:- start:67 stop:567 length:501 start_codon:yes stop_codon:yes gene_type:complete
MPKKCATCKRKKPLREFYANNSKKDKKQYSCKKCQKSYHNNNWYVKNRKSRLKTMRERRDRLNKIHYEKILFEYFIHGCVDCGNNDHRVLEFDHVKGVKKRIRNRSEGVGSLVRNGYKWDTIKKEIDKCKIRCRNCHQIKTHKQFNYKKYSREAIEKYKKKREQIN